MKQLIVITITLFLLGSGVHAAAKKGNVHFSNAFVYTVNEQQPLAQSVVVDNDIIVYVGDAQGAGKFVGPETKKIDLEGRLMLPGFIDTHIHLFIGAALGSGLALDMDDSPEDVAQKINAFAQANPDKKTIFASGLSGELGATSIDVKNLLDDAVSDRPVYILDSTMHNAWVNSKSLSIGKVNKDTPDVTGGTYVRDGNGVATGLIQGVPAQLPVIDAIGAIEPATVAEILPALAHEMNKLGYTGAIDYGAPISTEAVYTAALLADEAGDLNLRLFINYYVNTEEMAVDAIEKLGYYSQMMSSPNTRVNTLKILVDGTVENSKASLLHPYENSSDSGTLNLQPDTINQLVYDAAKKGYNVTGHTVGDNAVHVLLNAFEKARKAGFEDNIFSTSHSQLIAYEDRPRYKELDIIVQTTPQWATRKAAYPGTIGVERNETLQFPLRYWAHNDVTLAFGSDWPATDGGFDYGVNPFVGIYAALHRRHQPELLEIMGAEAEVLPPLTETLTLAEAIEAYTLGSATLMGTEQITGSIEVGKKADMIVLDSNLFNIEHSEIPSTKVVMTVMDGNIVYQAKAQ